MICRILLQLAALLLFASVVKAERIKTFTPPILETAKNPRYPKELQVTGREGWVTVNFMVDAEGKPYDITITASSGEQGFEQAAVSAIEKWEYTPASLDGEPIDAGNLVRITFQLSGATGASRAFSNAYRKFLGAVSGQDRELAAKYLSRLEKRDRNIYEESFYHLARYNYFVTWGSERQQYDAISRATFMDRGQGYLPEQALTDALFSELALELKLGKPGQAKLTAHSLLERRLPGDRREGVEKVLEQLEAVAQSDQLLVSEGRIADGYRFTHVLLKTSFSFTEIRGDIAELRLHCDRGYVGFVHESGMTYSVQNGVGNCLLTAIGDPGTTFKLLES